MKSKKYTFKMPWGSSGENDFLVESKCYFKHDYEITNVRSEKGFFPHTPKTKSRIITRTCKKCGHEQLASLRPCVRLDNR